MSVGCDGLLVVCACGRGHSGCVVSKNRRRGEGARQLGGARGHGAAKSRATTLDEARGEAAAGGGEAWGSGVEAGTLDRFAVQAEVGLARCGWGSGAAVRRPSARSALQADFNQGGGECTEMGTIEVAPALEECMSCLRLAGACHEKFALA
ncbi:hypothetical protein B0H17DRAFT_1141857 [Mycena rosella]|uniref:Uncharacterized protein n=1 Tax=Mycena rosella TaxID=1033263 RepID=A0AAD7CYX9_MYCRO|nr:hypothetical protein B0H17DRAFT_1141857 [Mycena rosella]